MMADRAVSRPYKCPSDGIKNAPISECDIGAFLGNSQTIVIIYGDMALSCPLSFLSLNMRVCAFTTGRRQGAHFAGIGDG